MRIPIRLTIMLATVTAAATAATAEAASAQDDPLTIGDPAAPLDIAHWMKGEAVTALAPGRVYVLEFWATWCGPCVGNMEHLSETQDAFKERGVTVIGLSDEPLAKTCQFLFMRYGPEQKLQNDRTRYALATDPDRSVHTDYFDAAGLSGIPAVFIIGKDARIEWIGGPRQMNEVLEAVVEDRWDRNAYREETLARQKRDMAAAQARRRVTTALENEAWEEAVTALDEVIAMGSERHIPTKYALLLSRMEQYDRGYAYGREVMEQSWDDNPWLLYQLAWVTSGSEQYPIENPHRDLDFALKVAKRSVQLTEAKEDMYLEMLASVHSARGEYAEAAASQEHAIELTEALRPQIQEHEVERYESSLARMRATLKTYEVAAGSK